MFFFWTVAELSLDRFLSTAIDSALVAARVDLIDFLVVKGILTLPSPTETDPVLVQRTLSSDFAHKLLDVVNKVNRGRMLRFLGYFCVDKSIPLPIELFSERLLREESFELLLLCDSFSPSFTDNLPATLVYSILRDIRRVPSESKSNFFRDVFMRRPDIAVLSETISSGFTKGSI